MEAFQRFVEDWNESFPIEFQEALMQLADNVTQNISIVFVKENICESFF